MNRLYLADLLPIIQAAGIPKDQQATALAIAEAESGLDATNFNGIAPDQSYGLWQINMLGNLGPDRRSKLGIADNNQLFDPKINAKAMALISGNGSNWNAWTTYTTTDPKKSYKRFLDYDTKYVNGQLDPGEAKGQGIDFGVGGIAKDVASSVTGNVGDFIKLLSSTDTWVRVLQVVGGAVLLVLGFVYLLRKPIAHGAVGVVTGGAV